ncbi:MAG: lytic transglycosylase domain-containing protein [Pseudomonadota bacterium]
MEQANAQNNAQEQTIITALKQADKKQWQQASQTITRVSDPLARDTLNWLRFTDGASDVTFQQINTFMRQNPDWPYQISIRKRAESLLPETYNSAQVIGWFSSQKPQSAAGMNRYLQALIQSGRSAEARKIMNDFWPDADLKREGQRHLYSRYQSLISPVAHQKRMNVLLHKGEYSNARGIASVLGSNAQKLTEARIALAKQSENVNALVASVPAKLKNDEGLLYERLRWRRRNDQNQGVLEILARSPEANLMHTPSDWWRERHIMTRRYMEQKNYRMAYKIASSHKQKTGFPKSQAEWLSGFLALRFLNQPRQAFTHFQTLYQNVSSPVSKSRGAYWAGRSAQAAGQPQVAQQWYSVAAKYNTRFYGQRALANLAQSYKPSYQSNIVLSAVAKQNFAQQKFAKAARWLSKAGYRSDAMAFLSKMSENLQTPQQYALLADFASSIEQDHSAIQISLQAEKEVEIVLGDTGYPQKISAIGQVHDVEWALVHALMRQESRFDQYAVSHAGALGLMQLMPATASQTARKIGVRHSKGWLTSKPSHNILLGSRYLREMLDRYNGYYPMAIAAYNAGPGRVDRWIEEIGDPRTGRIDLIDWIEQLPIYETRNYVQRVLEATYVYRHLLKTNKQPRRSPDPLHLASAQ